MNRASTYLPTALLIVAALAMPAAAQQQVPLKGTFQGTDAVNPTTLTTSGTGVGTLMGGFSLSQETSFITLNGSAHWIAANGDSVDSIFVALPDFSTAPFGYITVTENHTITGGTGRFAGAQGSFILERTHFIALSADGTHVTIGSFHGSITSPGANR